MKLSVYSRISKSLTAMAVLLALAAVCRVAAESRPNVVVIFTDDHRWDAVGASRNSRIQTPNIDRLSENGLYLPNAFVTLSICAPSRAALLTGRYGTHNGVVDMQTDLVIEEGTLAQRLGEAGYETSVFGKWHLKATPERLGFDYASTFYGLVPYWDVEFKRQGTEIATSGFVDDATTEEAVRYLERKRAEQPFFVWYNSFAPHMDNQFAWPARAQTLDKYPKSNLPLPRTWEGELLGKPPYLSRSRPRLRALEYGYAEAESVLDHIQGYYASVTDMDSAVGKLMDYLRHSGLADDTYVILMGDNGWFNSEHGLTSKVLAYEESIRVPMIVAGPEVQKGVRDELVLNIDIMPTVLELAGLEASDALQGRSLVPIMKGEPVSGWREYIYYEAPFPQHGTQPHLAVRTKEWKYIATYDDSSLQALQFEELYHLESDPEEQHNLASDITLKRILFEMRAKLEEARGRYTNPDRLLDSGK
ncbi:sulfatase-like hydrolase/transferase [Pelagicoccus sp. SDUM812002]|uniref:sulfatase-like hydrolase/transferase n=1 Tax=Pelagicoccus sp. SDUM812002 TaxID=3041266 RepID=UPI00280EC5FE|nr:sulfatase-like hydrolase/transferase [Pelagicoccus sp. SDUM812002]MDQ8187800.1 sulfatase-like hydrolase/transferase [Pelagicoccus sp. SDUM812002]